MGEVEGEHRCQPQMAPIGNSGRIPLGADLRSADAASARAAGKGPGRPWRVFPLLTGLGNHVVFFDPLADNLLARDRDLGPWEEDEAVKLIAGIDAARTF